MIDITSSRSKILFNLMNFSLKTIMFNYDVQHLEKLHELHNDLPFLPERMKIGKVEKLVTNSYYPHNKSKANTKP